MKEVKFRGFTTNLVNNMWVEGDLIHYDKDEFYIMPQNGRYWDISHDGDRVIKESIGKFTGFKDKNGKEIYEGDILKFEDGGIVYVSWDVEYTGFILIDPTGYQETEGIGNWILENVEVVGNIFDNKKLLDDY